MEIDTLTLPDKGKTPIGLKPLTDTQKISDFLPQNEVSKINNFEVSKDVPKIEMIVDWFQFTIFPNEKDFEKIKILYDKDYVNQDLIIPVLFKVLFNVDSINIIRDTIKLNGYDVVYCYNDIKIMLNSTREDMGVNILLSGQACRDYEKLGLDWFSLFNKIKEFDFNINRIDIALDSFTRKYFTLDKVYEYIINGNVSTRFRTTFEMKKRDLEKGILLGDTIQFGSKASQIEITFYNKLLERQNAGRIIDENIKDWYRCELRFRHESALDLFQKMSCNEDYSDFVFGILYYYIDFKNPFSKDTNKCRRPTVKWWSEFIGDNKKIKLSRKSSETSITKKYNWLLSSISKSEMMVYFSKLGNFDLDIITTDLMYEMLTRGLEKIEEKDLYMINSHRLSNKLNPITKGEILDYIQSLKDYIY